jgi:diguanylate cyclase (GGDEF)-like protein
VLDEDGTARAADDDAAMVVALRVEGDSLGALVIESRADRRWTTGERSTVEQVATVIASTIARVRAEAILEHEANHDGLTGLPQRKLVLEHLDRTLAQPAGHDTAAVMFIDLDHFKRVNDSLGHAAGDRLLELFSERLLTGVRGGDMAARLGGDEFVVVCSEINGTDEALAVGQRLLELVEAPFSIDGVEVFVGASIGIAIADGASDSATLLRHADTAAYRAKETGRNRCELFDDALRAEVQHRLATESALRRALERSELILHYQPIVRTVDASICGFEALVRWDRPGLGLVGPDEFLAIAEDSGLIVPIGLDVLRMGCSQAAAWQARFGATAPKVCINLSVLQLVQADFLGSFRGILAETGADPSQVILEITESSIMRDPARTVALLEELRALGLGLAIDDFGTGYSSLSHLRQLPVDELKIDRSFVFGIGCDQEGATIVASIVALAHALGMQIVAEGVETVEHVASLHNLGCDRMQGFYFSPALPADVATAMAARGHLRGPNAITA